MKRLKNYWRWDVGNPTVTEVKHLLMPMLPLEGTQFAIQFDRVWEWLIYFDWDSRKVNDILDSCPGELEWEASGEKFKRRLWSQRITEAIGFAEWYLDWRTETGKLPACVNKFVVDWENDPIPDWVFVETLQWLVRTKLEEPAPERLKMLWLGEGLVRYCGKLPDRPEEFGRQVAFTLTSDLDVVETYIDRAVQVSLTTELWEEMRLKFPKNGVRTP